MPFELVTNLFSNDALHRIDYPNPSTGAAGTTAAQQVTFSYNLLGDTIGMTDQNGTTHAYNYDVLDRLSTDLISSFGSGVDVGVKGLGYSYNAMGLPYQVSSLGFELGVINQLQYDYNGYGELTDEYQSLYGAVNTTTTPDVVYSYSQPSGANYSRLSSMTYPNGRVLDYDYHASALENHITGVTGALADIGGLATTTPCPGTWWGVPGLLDSLITNLRKAYTGKPQEGLIHQGAREAAKAAGASDNAANNWGNAADIVSQLAGLLHSDGCFVAGTPVLVSADEPNLANSASVEQADSSMFGHVNRTYVAAGIALGGLYVTYLIERLRHEQMKEQARKRRGETEPLELPLRHGDRPARGRLGARLKPISPFSAMPIAGGACPV